MSGLHSAIGKQTSSVSHDPDSGSPPPHTHAGIHTQYIHAWYPPNCSLLTCMSVTWCWCTSLCSLHSWISLDITTRTLVPRREMFTFPFTNSWWPLGIHLFVTPPNSISKILGHKLMSLVAICCQVSGDVSSARVCTRLSWWAAAVGAATICTAGAQQTVVTQYLHSSYTVHSTVQLYTSQTTVHCDSRHSSYDVYNNNLEWSFFVKLASLSH